MVAGHLQEKKGLFYIVLSYKDANGRRRTKWIATGLPVKGNKKRAEKLLMEARNDFVVEEPEVIASTFSRDMLFADFMLKWLEIVKPTIQLVTYSSYCNMVKGVIVPYFKETGVTLGGFPPPSTGLLLERQPPPEGPPRRGRSPGGRLQERSAILRRPVPRACGRAAQGSVRLSGALKH